MILDGGVTLFFGIGLNFGHLLILEDFVKKTFVPGLVLPVPVPCPVPPVPVPKTSGFRIPVRFASLLN